MLKNLDKTLGDISDLYEIFGTPFQFFRAFFEGFGKGIRLKPSFHKRAPPRSSITFGVRIGSSGSIS